MKNCQKITTILVLIKVFYFSCPHMLVYGRISKLIACRHFGPKTQPWLFEADKLLLDSTQRSIFPLIFSLKVLLLITMSILTLSHKYTLCTSNNIRSHRWGEIGSQVLPHKLESTPQYPSQRTEDRGTFGWFFDNTLDHVTTEGYFTNCN